MLSKKCFMSLRKGFLWDDCKGREWESHPTSGQDKKGNYSYSIFSFIKVIQRTTRTHTLSCWFVNLCLFHFAFLSDEMLQLEGS